MSELQVHTLVATVQDHPGVLTRVASLFRRRGFNIASLAVGHSEEPGYSRMTIAVEGSADEVRQCEKQLYKLIEVNSVRNLTGTAAITCELALVKVRVDASDRTALAEVTDIYRGEIVDVSKSSMIVQMTGGQAKVDRFLDVISEYPIEEISRTGAIAMARESTHGGDG
jgi:acetolactate synthase-1/3 small subunit